MIGRLLVGLIRGYQFVLSPVLGARCRYYPSCSRYAAQSITTHGPIVGVALGSWRILRCHPWTPGGIDLVPGRGLVGAYLRDRDAAGCGDIPADDGAGDPGAAHVHHSDHPSAHAA